jgi:hypothetical protein
MKRWLPAPGIAGRGVILDGLQQQRCGDLASISRPVCFPGGPGLADLAAGNFTAVEAKFDPAMMTAARTLPLQKAWAGCQDALGTYRSHGAPTFARTGQFDLEQVPVTWANEPSVVTITFNPNGTIDGLHCYGVPPS